MKKIVSAITMPLVMAGCATPVKDIDQQVDELYNRMTQEERIAQLRSCYMNDYFTENGKLDTAKCKKEMPFGIGHFSQFASQMSEDPNVIRDRVAIMQDWLIHNTPSGIPALFHEEVLTGACTRDATVYPQQIGLACSFNPELARVKAVQTGQSLRQIGGLFSLSPMVDVVRTPSFNRLEESYGEDAYLSAVFGTAFTQGLQQGDLRIGVGTCSKHFLGYGGGGDASEKELMEEILLPHETMIRLAGSKVVMTGYHAIDGVSCVANEKIQEGILRNYLGFDGMMVSDYNSIDQIVGIEAPLERCVAAMNAGNDVEFPRGENDLYLQEALDKGLVSMERFEQAVKNVLRYKARVGLLDENPNLYSTEHIQFDTPEERQTAYTLAAQSIVMLKNDGILPLFRESTSQQVNESAQPLADASQLACRRTRQQGDESTSQQDNKSTRRQVNKATSQRGDEATSHPKNILLTGPNANTMWAMLGDYTFQSMRYFWQVKNEDDMHPKIVSFKEGLENKLPKDVHLSYTRGCDWTEIIETWIEDGGDQRADWLKRILDRKVEHPEEANEAEALRLAAQSDVIIAAVGENVLLSGENRERPTMHLPGRQEEFVNHLIATGKPVVLVVFGGRCQIISDLAERCAAVIQAWYPGEEGGNAVADILLGNVSPSGKLSVSYPNVEIKDQPICYNYSAERDERIEWPFGYGLSYTTFQYSNLQVESAVPTTSETTTVSFEVQNTGKVEADEVAQLYLSPTSPDQPIRPIQLQGFARVTLKPGEKKQVTINLATEQFGYYADQHWNIAPGKYQVKIGSSSQDIRLSETIELTGNKMDKPLRTIYFSETKISK